jgi:xanthine dehydrogenase small subunit
MGEPVRAIRFMLDGETVTADDFAPSTTLLHYLRERLGRCGTKEGCAEGDCGACTVLLGEPGADRIHYRPVNACIRFLASVDGREVVTVESLTQPDGTLHPVQQAMVESHGSQCGFCTPGFVMSLFGLWLDSPQPSREAVLEALSGNLCRCTGYRPIVEAGLAMGSHPEPVRWSRRDAADPAKLEALRAIERSEPLKRPGWQAPRNIAELSAALLGNPSALLLAGGTDVALWSNKQLRELPDMIWLGEVAELKMIGHTEGGLEIGAAVSLEDAYRAITAPWPQLAELALRFASPPVRNSGTLCGNIGNGSPIGDSMPWLMALGASLLLQRGDRQRRVTLEEFHTGYRRNLLEPGEFIRAVHVPAPKPGQRFACYKISRRFEQDISAVCSALSIQVEHGRITDVRLGFGGMAATPARARNAERALAGQAFERASFEAAQRALAEDFAPLSDHRASSRYRREVAANMLMRFWLEHGEGLRGLRVEEVQPA